MDFFFGLVCATFFSLANAQTATTLTPTAYPLYPEFDNCGFNLNATCDDKMKLFADGKLLATSEDWKKTSVVYIPPNTGEIEIHCIDGWILGGILASSENGLITNNAWNCSSDNGTTWNNAHELGANGVTAEDISPDAKWIWTDRPTWTHTKQKRHTTAICTIQLPNKCGTTPTPTPSTTTPCTECVPCLFSGTTPTPTLTPTTTTTPTPTTPEPTPGFNLNATCNNKMELFVDRNLLATSYNWRDTSQVHIPARTQTIEIHCSDSCWLIEGILASSDNGLITDNSWNCSSDNGITWSSAHEIVPNGLSVPDISPDAKWISTGQNTWMDGGKVICKVMLDVSAATTTTSKGIQPESTTPITTGCLYTDKYVECPEFKNQCKTGNFVDCMNRDCAKTCKCGPQCEDCSPWSSWSSCSSTCGIAVKTRTRTCPKLPCLNGITEETASCHLSSCGCEMENINFSGNDIPGGLSTQKDWQSCQTKCQTNANCTHWTFRNSDGNCWIKTGINAQSKEDGLVSGPKDCSDTCPNGWTSISSGCYRFVKAGSYSEATTNCNNEGGHLVEIDNQEEQNALAQFHKESNIKTHVWLGGTDMNIEGQWVGNYSGREIMNFNGWYSKRPGGGFTENCVFTHIAWQFKWYDFSCSWKGDAAALCEYSDQDQTLTTTSLVNPDLCPIGWTSVLSGCYRFVRAGSYIEATTNCNNGGGYLVEIDNQEEQNALAQFHKESHLKILVWLGGTDMNREGHWVGNYSGREIMNFNGWYSQRPGGGFTENCVFTHISWQFKWYDFSCSWKGNAAALCEHSDQDETLTTTSLANPDPCPIGWTSVLSGCYRFVRARSYIEATTNCNNEGGYLVEIDNQEEQDALAQFHKDSKLKTHVWLGGTDTKIEGQWVGNYSEKEIMNFNGWYSNRPGGKTDENCVFTHINYQFKWYDYSCSWKGDAAALCEYSEQNETPTTTTIPNKEPELNGYCLTSGGDDQNGGTQSLKAGGKDACYHQCKAIPQATGCEWNKYGGCMYHTLDVANGNGNSFYKCWVFNSSPTDGNGVPLK